MSTEHKFKAYLKVIFKDVKMLPCFYQWMSKLEVRYTGYAWLTNLNFIIYDLFWNNLICHENDICDNWYNHTTYFLVSILLSCLISTNKSQIGYHDSLARSYCRIIIINISICVLNRHDSATLSTKTLVSGTHFYRQSFEYQLPRSLASL